MDGERIHAEVVYPNVGGFGSAGFLKLGEPELMLDCVRAYNDFLTEWTGEDPGRLVPVTATPFWDVQATAAEVERCAARGHRAVLMCGQPQDFGQPALSEKYWDPLWATAQEAGLSISFHIGSGGPNDSLYQRPSMSVRTNMARVSGLIFVQNANSLADIIFGGVCQRFPELKFVSVESGVGWLQSVLEGFDWQFMNCQVRRDNPELELLPSEYFKRQIYGCFWFEQRGIEAALAAFPDNLMWETDFPHPTCQHPGPLNTWATRARRIRGACAGRRARRNPAQGAPRQRRRPVRTGLSELGRPGETERWRNRPRSTAGTTAPETTGSMPSTCASTSAKRSPRSRPGCRFAATPR